MNIDSKNREMLESLVNQEVGCTGGRLTTCEVQERRSENRLRFNAVSEAEVLTLDVQFISDGVTYQGQMEVIYWASDQEWDIEAIDINPVRASDS